MRLPGLGWKACYHISPKHHIRAAAARLLTKAQHIAGQMPPFHSFQDQIITMLDRQMKMRHQPLFLGQHRHQLGIRFRRVDGGKTQARQFRHFSQNLTHQPTQPWPPRQILTPAGQIHAAQHDFSRIARYQRAHLINHRPGPD